jgi:MFS transporter, PAT family, solute carrier family 33 (acetyl-CoA transportor), member 1
LKLVDFFTEATCHPSTEKLIATDLKGPLVTQPFSCALQVDKEKCLNGGGSCEMLRDGYYIVNILCVLFGAVTFVMFIRPKVLYLQSLPLRAWRLAPSASGGGGHANR